MNQKIEYGEQPSFQESAKALTSPDESTSPRTLNPFDNGDIEKQQGAEALSFHASSATRASETVSDGVDRNISEAELATEWPRAKKWKNTLLIATLTLLTPFASSMIAPATDDVMRDMHTTNPELGSFMVSIYLLGYAFGPLFLAPCSELYGRLPVYHGCTILFIVTNVACALSINMPMLIIFRFLTGLVGAGPLTVGPGTVADCFAQVERGRAMAVWTMPVLLGPCLGPAVGAYLSRSLGWRWSFWFLIIVSGIVFLLCLIFQDESHPSILRRKHIRRLQKENPDCNLPSSMSAQRVPEILIFTQSIIRPIKMLFLSPIILGLSLLTAVAYGTLYLLFTTVTDVFETRYGIVTNVGLVYLGFGVGQFAGLAVFGAVSDRFVKKMAKGGELKPEYRLPVMIPGGAMIPVGLLMYGWTAQYRVFWFVPIIGTFLVGFGMITVFTPVGTYLVDAFPVHAASATAANTVFRSIGGAMLPLAGAKMYKALGQGWGNTLLAGISLGLMGMILLAVKYGERLRTHPKYQLKL